MQDAPIELGSLDPLDRDVRAAALWLEKLRARLATEEGRKAAAAMDPWGAARHVATRTTYRLLATRPTSVHEAPHRDALLRWIHELTQARIGLDLELADADAVHAIDERLPRRARKAAPGDEADAAVAPLDAIARTFAEASARVLTDEPSRGALERAAELAAGVAAVRKERRARRFEAARRLELAHPFALACDPSALAGQARALLDATEPLARELLRAAQKPRRGAWRAADGIHLGLAKDAQEGWPARLTVRWLRDSFRAIAPRDVLGAAHVLPAALGGASFLRAAAHWGFALRTAGAPRSLPFAMVRDPYPTPAHRFAGAAAAAVASAAFQRRVLGLSSRVAQAQARSLSRSLFFGIRTLAARFVLASGEAADVTLFEELGMRTFGAPLPESLADAWPAPRVDEPARFAGALGAHAFVRTLIDRYDEDWFSNPRAGAFLAQIAAAPAFDADPPEKQAPLALARAFEGALG